MARAIMYIGLVVLVLFLTGWYFLTQPILFKVDKISSALNFDPESLRVHINTLVKEFFPRDEKNVNNLNRCANYIKSEFRKRTPHASYQEFSINGELYRNVIASFGSEKGERIIVGAHYDTAGEQPGADDNASGVAGLLALAEQLSKEKLTSRIDLVAYTLEEPPNYRTSNMGSAWHVDWLKQNKVEIKLMVALEMLGYYSDEPGSQDYPLPLLKLFYPTTGNYIAVVGKIADGGITKSAKKLMRAASEVPVYSINAPRFIPGIDFSDHLNFWNAGYPAIMITDTAFYRNKDYHDIGDVPQNLDYQKMAEVLKGVFNLISKY